MKDGDKMLIGHPSFLSVNHIAPILPERYSTTLDMDHFSCPICLDATKNGLLCPKCYKPFCADCIARYFVSTRTTGASGCPYCKEDVRFKDFFRMGWLNDLQDEVAVMKKRDADPCTSHPDHHLDMFCTACKIVCCFTCSNEDHNDHPMEPIRKAHQRVKTTWDTLQTSLESTEEIEAAYQKMTQKIADVQAEGKRKIKSITQVRNDANFGQKAFDFMERMFQFKVSYRMRFIIYVYIQPSPQDKTVLSINIICSLSNLD